MRTAFFIVASFLSLSCQRTSQLSNEKAEELVKLNYRQQNQAGEGTWTILKINVDSIQPVKKDTAVFNVYVRVDGLYKAVFTDSVQQINEQFYDTLQFTARKMNKVWMADKWTIVGSRHE